MHGLAAFRTGRRRTVFGHDAHAGSGAVSNSLSPINAENEAAIRYLNKRFPGLSVCPVPDSRNLKQNLMGAGGCETTSEIVSDSSLPALLASVPVPPGWAVSFGRFGWRGRASLLAVERVGRLRGLFLATAFDRKRRFQPLLRNAEPRLFVERAHALAAGSRHSSACLRNLSASSAMHPRSSTEF